MDSLKFDTFIKGKNIKIVVSDEDCVLKTNWYNWFNDSEIIKNMQKHYYPRTILLK